MFDLMSGKRRKDSVREEQPDNYCRDSIKHSVGASLLQDMDGAFSPFSSVRDQRFTLWLGYSRLAELANPGRDDLTLDL